MEKKKATPKKQLAAPLTNEELEQIKKLPYSKEKNKFNLSEKFLLTTRELAELTGFEVTTLNQHRHLGMGFPYVRVGGKPDGTGGTVRYRVKDIAKYVDALQPILAEGTEMLPDPKVD